MRALAALRTSAPRGVVTAAPLRLRRWAVAGALLGAAAGALAFAPAAWLARAAATATDQRLLLADARGTVWRGSAVAVLTGGAGSRSATALPGRLEWSLGWADGAFELRTTMACCLRGEPRLRVAPGIGRVQLALRPAAGEAAVGQWPAAWLAGLGTPWNTLQLDGELRLATAGLAVENVRGRWRSEGKATLELADVASRLSTLPALGSYRLTLDGGGDALALALTTLDGALRLDASGQWAASGLRLRGEASAAPGAEAALSNLLNIIGRRQGARSLIAIG